MEEKYKRYIDKERRKEYNRLYQRDYMKRYRAKAKAEGRKILWNSTYYQRRLRERAIVKLGGPVCVNCSCNIIELLEINHINGGGRQERKGRKPKQYYLDIIHNRVDLSGFNVLCKVCNIHHYVESILGFKGHKIAWVA